ncbi:MAG: DnaJ domain-containing protein [Candidatus Sumerlaeaceae bacterium]|nr:DnaJ domain-containing protein [Candidatus Sumerlaeaceae bacterium]
MSKTYYEILGLPTDASEQQVKTAYHALARKHHPDKATSADDLAALEAEFSRISAAYNILKDKEKREAYNKTLQAQRENALAGGSGSSGNRQNAAQSPSLSGQSAKTGMTTQQGFDQSRASVAKRAYTRGLQLFSSGDYAKASEFFEVAIKNNPGEASYHARLALTLLRGHRSFNRAIEAAQRAITIDPYNSDYRLVLAELYESAGISSMAIKTYEEILRWDATNDKAKAGLETLQPTKKSFFSRLFKK